MPFFPRDTAIYKYSMKKRYQHRIFNELSRTCLSRRRWLRWFAVPVCQILSRRSSSRTPMLNKRLTCYAWSRRSLRLERLTQNSWKIITRQLCNRQYRRLKLSSQLKARRTCRRRHPASRWHTRWWPLVRYPLMWAYSTLPNQRLILDICPNRLAHRWLPTRLVTLCLKRSIYKTCQCNRWCSQTRALSAPPTARIPLMRDFRTLAFSCAVVQATALQRQLVNQTPSFPQPLFFTRLRTALMVSNRRTLEVR